MYKNHSLPTIGRDNGLPKFIYFLRRANGTWSIIFEEGRAEWRDIITGETLSVEEFEKFTEDSYETKSNSIETDQRYEAYKCTREQRELWRSVAREHIATYKASAFGTAQATLALLKAVQAKCSTMKPNDKETKKALKRDAKREKETRSR